MCFSPEGDLVGGVVVAAIGVDACVHLRGRTEYVFIAGLPLILGIHQIDEAFVWWSLQGHFSPEVGRVAMWAYLLFAFVVLPPLVPLLVRSIEPTKALRRRIVPFVVLGFGVAGVLLATMLHTPPTASLGAYHLAYSIGLQHGILVIGAYIVATCGSMLASKITHVVWFGVANLVAVAILARLSADGFASLWCFYAALASGAIALYLRLSDPAPSEEVAMASPRPSDGGAGS
jgi:hypothetical protein